MTHASKIFLKDGEDEFTYGDLAKFVSGASAYFPVIKTASIKDFFYRLVLALANNKDVLLADEDFKQDNPELKKAAFLSDEDRELAPGECFKDVDLLISAVEKSTSNIVLFSSGTSGQRKIVSHQMQSFLRSVRKSATSSKDLWGFAYNPAHMAGLQVFFQAFLNANTLVNLFGKGKEEIFSLVDKNSITHISATPTFYRMLFPENNTHRSLRRITCGGEKSGASLHAKLLRIFPNARINNIYAATEFGTLLVSDGEYFAISPECSGKIKIEDSELLVSGKLLGKITGGEGVNPPCADGWYKTGDMVEFADKERRLFKFTARKKNFLNVGGYKVNIEEVEDAIRQMPQIEDALVYGRKNSVTGNVLCADIKLLPGSELSQRDVRIFLEAKLQNFKIPRKINFVGAMERTNSGKIKR